MDFRTVYHGRRSESIGDYKAYRELGEPSSIDLLRASIFQSLRKKEIEKQNFLEEKYDSSKNIQTENYSPSKYTVLKVEHLDRKNSSASFEDTESDISDLENSISLDKEKNETSMNKAIKTEETNVEANAKNSINSLELNDKELEEVSMKNDAEMKIEESKCRSDSDTNGFKLARRKFSDTIFEDCSTYNITCPNVNLNNENEHPQKVVEPLTNNKLNELNSVDVNLEARTFYEKKLEEQTSLCDTFFPRVMNGEYNSPTLPKRQESFKSVDSNSAIENDMDDIESSCDTVEDQTVKDREPVRRKYSRRHRKRSRRRSKSKKPHVYECPKCGVSYICPTKRMNDIACCLHCDLWTPVEPVFVKREKTTWNTCRIC